MNPPTSGVQAVRQSDRFRPWYGRRPAETPVFAYKFDYARPVDPIFDMHYDIEFGIVVRGAVLRCLGARERRLTEGDVWLSGPWERHGVTVVEYPTSIFAFSIVPHWLASARFGFAAEADWYGPFVADVDYKLSSPVEDRPGMVAAAREGMRLVGGQDWRSRSRLVFLLFDMLLALRPPPPVPGVAAVVTDDAFDAIRRAVGHVLGQRHRLTAAAAARNVGVAPRRFLSLFHRIMREPFGVFELNHRLGGAAAQLLATEDSVKKVSLDWGFTDSSHFHRHFTRRYECTPTAYRCGNPALDPPRREAPSVTAR